MKLKLRSLETKETLRVEIPNSSTLQDLRQVISQIIDSSSPSSIHISLNRKDEFHSSSSDDRLDSLGLRSGDLIFFTLNPNSFSSQTLTGSSTSANVAETLENPPKSSIGDCMEIDETVSVLDSRKSFSVPGFLRKVFTDELGDVGGRRHEILVIAVHAILLESGFVRFNPVSNTVINGFNLPNDWPLFAFMMNLSYTLPDVITKSPNNPKGTDFVVLKFQTLGKFFNVYGSLSSGTTTHLIRLDEDQLIPFLNIVWANCGLADEIRVKQGIYSKTTTPEAEVFKFWKNVKDMLALPLLMDLCEKSGLKLPPCFMVLPTDIKLKIFESLNGEEIAKVGSVCSELRYLTSTDNLWKQKLRGLYRERSKEVNLFQIYNMDSDSEDQFFKLKEIEGGNWKEKFVFEFWRRKSYKMDGLMRRSEYYPRARFPSGTGGYHDVWPNPGPLPGRNFIGGDYDRLPNLNLGVPPQLRIFNWTRTPRVILRDNFVVFEA